MKKKVLLHHKFIQPSFVSLLEKKRDNGEFCEEEIRYIVESILRKKIPDHQLTALIMIIYFQGLSAQETSTLTEEMMLSGEVMDLNDFAKPKIDSYATGGVGDKTRLILPALAAACNVISPSMRDTDEDFIISDIDKLKSIPGFSASMNIESFKEKLSKVGCVISRHIEELAPVGKLLHRMRKDIGATPSLQLITASVLSKKLAEGVEGLVVDVKWGNGSFIKEIEQAKQLARSITRVARSMKRRCVALITDMNQPLGNTIGTSLEIKEAIALLHGKGPEDLQNLLLKIGMEIVRLGGVAGSTLSAKQVVQRAIYDGAALQKFKEMIESQGGRGDWVDNLNKFPVAKYIRKLPAPKRGYVHTVNSGMMARGVKILSTNRDGSINPMVGVSEIKKIGTQVKQGEPLMMIHYNDDSHLDSALEYLRSAYRLAPKRPNAPTLIIERIA